MCITFFYVASAGEARSGFKLVVLMNRDEFMARETDPASWLDGVLAGRDMQKGKEGGTWLGINESGSVGLLTNIFTGVAPQKAGRGFLVVDYLKGDQNATEYLEQLSQNQVDYNPFNLLLFEKENSGLYVPHYYGKGSGTIPSSLPMSLVPGVVHGLGNHPFSTPFLKTLQGKEKMTQLLAENASNKDQLIRKALEMLSSSESCFPDPQMLTQKHPKSPLTEEYMTALSSIFVDCDASYGTRMQTVILVDFEDNVTFAERTRLSNQSDDGQPKWSDLNKFEFKAKL